MTESVEQLSQLMHLHSLRVHYYDYLLISLKSWITLRVENQHTNAEEKYATLIR